MSDFRPRFFIAEGSQVPPAELTLEPADSHHALHVLRLHVGDRCEVVVGGTVYAALVSRAEDPVKVEVTARLEGSEAGASYRGQVGLVQVLSRPGLFDQVLEKGTEVGASFFVCIPAAGPVRLSEQSCSRRLARWRRIVLEAAKQSKQVAVPSVDCMGSVGEALIGMQARGAVSIVLEPGSAAQLQDIVGLAGATGAPLALWIGPEGGWSSTDREQFTEAGVMMARLGQGVLRSETAGPVAAAIARLLQRDW